MAEIVASIGVGSAGIGKIAGAGTTLVGKRIVEKYLRGASLRAIKSFLRGIWYYPPSCFTPLS